MESRHKKKLIKETPMFSSRSVARPVFLLSPVDPDPQHSISIDCALLSDGKDISQCRMPRAAPITATNVTSEAVSGKVSVMCGGVTNPAEREGQKFNLKSKDSINEDASRIVRAEGLPATSSVLCIGVVASSQKCLASLRTSQRERQNCNGYARLIPVSCYSALLPSAPPARINAICP